MDLRPALLNTEGGGDHRVRVHLPPDINGTDHHAVAPQQIIQIGDVHQGDVVIGLTADWHWWCTVPVELAVSEMHGAAQRGGVEDAIQADHTLLVAQVESFMSIAQVTIADLARKLACAEADIKAWFESEQCRKVQKQYDEALWEIQFEQPPWWGPVAARRSLWVAKP